MTQRYYILRFERNDGIHHSGDKKPNAENPLRIGQHSSCDIQLPNHSQYEDTDLAVIEKRTDGDGWKIIRLSPFKEHELKVNGTPINYVHFLNDGERIAFEGQKQELVFNIREDDKFTSANIIYNWRRDNRAMIVWIAFISLIVIGLVLHQLYANTMTQRMIASAKQSVLQIQVDSVQLVVIQGDSVIVKRTTKLKDQFGHAFLTTDGKLVTARHCIEPWLDIPEEASEMDTVNPATSLIVKMALEAVTRNIIAESTGDSSQWQMISYCSLRKSKNDTVILNIKSSDFIINNSRDNIVSYGDYDHQYFWRSITVRPRRVDMMLGDFAYIPKISLPLKGSIRIATKEEIRKFCQTSNRPIIILGRTTTDLNSKQIESPEAKLIRTLEATDFSDDGYPDVVISHNGGISKGFSGGPILTQCGLFRWCAIGIVSVKDKQTDNRFYSVPITEIERMQDQLKQ